jgi:SAM-dependent methyltransferase
MNEKAWYESFFGEDYFEIYEGVLRPEVAAEHVEGIVSLLDLQPGARILDLACGHGRHSILLAKRGFDVTGYDLSEIFLARARANADKEGVSVRWIQGDMRELPFDAEFDAAINVFTSFGYFEDPDDDVRTLWGLRASLKPEGRFLLETLHRDGLTARFQPQSFERMSTGSIVLHERRWDLARDVIDDAVTLIRPDGTRTEYTTTVRLRSLDEFIALMRESGLVVDFWHGGLDGSNLELSSHRLVLVGRRGA